MKKTDFRAYLTLEIALTRKLQKDWAKRSAPIYRAITDACRDRNWDEARRLVTELDMTEVGTNNREYIKYLLLCCAVYGANMVARSQPSFVGVGTFDATLNLVTQNFLAYLEHGATAEVQEAALQLIAQDEAGVKVTKFDSNHDDRGRFSSSNQTKTPEFKAWFGDWEDPHAWSSRKDPGKPDVSMAVDTITHKPLVMYHSTTRNFDQFQTGVPSKNSGTFGLSDVTRHGIFMTPDKDFSQEFVGEGYNKHPQGAQVLPVYANIKYPLDLRKDDVFDEDTLGEYEKQGINPKWLTKFSPEDSWEMFDDADGKAFVEASKKIGYDGAIIKEKDRKGYEADTWVAFDPVQVKSSLGNSGSFDPKNAHITKFDKNHDELGRFATSGGSRGPIDRDGWVSPSGIFYANETTGKFSHHDQTAKRLGFKGGYEDAFEGGFSRIKIMGGSSWAYVDTNGDVRDIKTRSLMEHIIRRIPPEVSHIDVNAKDNHYEWSGSNLLVRKFDPYHDPQTGKFSSGVSGLDNLPVEQILNEPGQAKIPAGTIRLFHYTDGKDYADARKNLASIRDNGILQGKAKGDTYGEPNVVWGSTHVPGDFKQFVEFYVKPEDIGIGSPVERYQGAPPITQARIDDFNAGDHDVTLYGNVPKEHIVGVHEPWHDTYRYMVENPEARESIRNGEQNIYLVNDNRFYNTPEGEGMRRWVKDHPEDAPTTQKTEHLHKFGNTQVCLPPGEASDALDGIRDSIPQEDLAGDGVGIGGNHITVRYGIKGDTAGIKEYLRKQAPFDVTLGKTITFPPSEHSDGAAPIVCQIDSPDLCRMNAELEQAGEFTEPSFASYKPHATVAYVRPEVADKYTGLTTPQGLKVHVTSIYIMDRDGGSEEIPLQGAVKFDPNHDAAGRFASSDAMGTAAVAPTGTPLTLPQLQSIAQKLGYPPEKIKVAEPKTFVLGDRTFSKMADFNPTTKDITVYPRMCLGQEEPTMVHEIMHAKYQAVTNAMKREEATWKHEHPQTFRDFPNEHDKAEFPVTWKMHELMGDKQQLTKDDGVTPYSEAYWKQDGPSFDHSVNETLAEMSRVEHETGTLPGTERWKSLYHYVKATAETL